MDYDLNEERGAKGAVDELVRQFNAGKLTEEALIDRLVALPTVPQAPHPHTDWYDAIIVRTGPVTAAKRAAYDGRLPVPVYVKAARRMLDAGHSA